MSQSHCNLFNWNSRPVWLSCSPGGLKLHRACPPQQQHHQHPFSWSAASAHLFGKPQQQQQQQQQTTSQQQPVHASSSSDLRSNGSRSSCNSAAGVEGRPLAINNGSSSADWTQGQLLLTVPYEELVSARYLPTKRLHPEPPPTGKKQQHMRPHLHLLSAQTGPVLHHLELGLLRRSGRGQPRGQWRLQLLELTAPDREQVRAWAATLNCELRSQTHRPQRLLVFVNPFGGKRRAGVVWSQLGAPLFDRCHIDYTVVETQAAGHARSYVEQLPPHQLQLLDGIIAVGGDGLFAEVLLGLTLQPKQQLVQQLRLGHVPAGSTDAVACTLNGTRDPATALLHIVLGDGHPLDVALIVNTSARPTAAAPHSSSSSTHRAKRDALPGPAAEGGGGGEDLLQQQQHQQHQQQAANVSDEPQLLATAGGALAARTGAPGAVTESASMTSSRHPVDAKSERLSAEVAPALPRIRTSVHPVAPRAASAACARAEAAGQLPTAAAAAAGSTEPVVAASKAADAAHVSIDMPVATVSSTADTGLFKRAGLSGTEQAAAAAGRSTRSAATTTSSSSSSGGGSQSKGQEDGPLAMPFVCVSNYGFLGDVLQLSEKLRWMGPMRYDVAGVLRLLLLRSYDVTLTYLPAEDAAAVAAEGVAGPDSAGGPGSTSPAVQQGRADRVPHLAGSSGLEESPHGAAESTWVAPDGWPLASSGASDGWMPLPGTPLAPSVAGEPSPTPPPPPAAVSGEAAGVRSSNPAAAAAGGASWSPASAGVGGRGAVQGHASPCSTVAESDDYGIHVSRDGSSSEASPTAVESAALLRGSGRHHTGATPPSSAPTPRWLARWVRRRASRSAADAEEDSVVSVDAPAGASVQTSAGSLSVKASADSAGCFANCVVCRSASARREERWKQHAEVVAAWHAQHGQHTHHSTQRAAAGSQRQQAWPHCLAASSPRSTAQKAREQQQESPGSPCLRCQLSATVNFGQLEPPTPTVHANWQPWLQQSQLLAVLGPYLLDSPPVTPKHGISSGGQRSSQPGWMLQPLTAGCEPATPSAAAGSSQQDVPGSTILPGGWRRLKGKYASIMCAVTSCRSDRSTRGLAPGAHLADGRLVLVLVRSCSRLQYLRFLLMLSRCGVWPGMLPYVEVLHVTSLKVESRGRVGYWNVDGELLKAPCVQLGVLPAPVQVFARGVERLE